MYHVFSLDKITFNTNGLIKVIETFFFEHKGPLKN